MDFSPQQMKPLIRLNALASTSDLRRDLARVADRQLGCFAYLCLRCGLQVTQAVAQPLGSQAELAILLLDTGHTLEHHFIILSGQSTLQSARTCERVRVRSATHASPFWSRKNSPPPTTTTTNVHTNVPF